MANGDSLLKKGCMGCLLVYGACLMLVFILYFLSNLTSCENDVTKEVTYFEVTTRKGRAKLHLGMPKDSVILLLGHPDESSAHSFGSTVRETIGYKIRNNYITDLTFHFENGKMESYDQN